MYVYDFILYVHMYVCYFSFLFFIIYYIGYGSDKTLWYSKQQNLLYNAHSCNITTSLQEGIQSCYRPTRRANSPMSHIKSYSQKSHRCNRLNLLLSAKRKNELWNCRSKWKLSKAIQFFFVSLFLSFYFIFYW